MYFVSLCGYGEHTLDSMEKQTCHLLEWLKAGLKLNLRQVIYFKQIYIKKNIYHIYIIEHVQEIYILKIYNIYKIEYVQENKRHFSLLVRIALRKFY